MGLRIATNVQSLAAQRSMSKVRMGQEKSMERLSSGSRIVRSADDAAGLAISEKLKADIRSTQQATRNAADGVSMIQTAEGGLNETSAILIRLRELSIQSASDTIGDTERQFSDLEFQSLVKEVDRISNATQFNGKDLLTGEGDIVEIQIGKGNNGEIDRLNYDLSKTNSSVDNLGVGGLGVGSKEDAQNNLTSLDDAISKVSGNRAELGALQNRLESTINNLEVTNENLSAANSRIRDTDVASESAELTKSNILMSASTSILGQANNSGSAALKLIG